MAVINENRNVITAFYCCKGLLKLNISTAPYLFVSLIPIRQTFIRQVLGFRVLFGLSEQFFRVFRERHFQ